MYLQFEGNYALLQVLIRIRIVGRVVSVATASCNAATVLATAAWHRLIADEKQTNIFQSLMSPEFIAALWLNT
jgi:hypothetical protein